MPDDFLLLELLDEWENDEDPLPDEELEEYCEDSDTEDSGEDQKKSK